MSEVSCCSCSGTGFRSLIDFINIPLTGLFRESINSGLPKADLGIELCSNCGLIRQKAGSGPREYVEVARSTELQFPTYVHALIGRLKEYGIGPDDLVLEVGANDGIFMSALRDAGFNNLVGVEPSQDLAVAARARGHNVVCDYFGPDLVAMLLAQLYNFWLDRSFVSSRSFDRLYHPLYSFGLGICYWWITHQFDARR